MHIALLVSEVRALTSVLLDHLATKLGKARMGTSFLNLKPLTLISLNSQQCLCGIKPSNQR